MKKIVCEKELVEIAEALREKGKCIISTSGCFDILHAGHVMYLKEAKSQGDVLIVFLNSDQSVQKLKGLNRPVVPEKERACVIAGLESVDYICIFDEDTPCRLIRTVMPDAVIKGGDYEGKHIPEMDTVAEYGGCVKYVHFKEGWSTTNIIEKIKHLQDE